MTPKDPGPVPCPRPGCPNEVASGTGPGRRRMYCSEACGRAVRKLRSSQRTPETKAHDEDALRVVDDMAGRLDVLRTHIRAGDALAGLRQVVELSGDLECATLAVVRQARDRGLKGPAIAAALHISVDKLGRDYTEDRIIRKMTQRQERRPAGPALAPGAMPRPAPPLPAARPEQPAGPGRPDPFPRAARTDGERRRAGAGRTAPPRRGHPEGAADAGGGRGGRGDETGGRAGTESGPPGQDPGTALAAALSHLQRAGHKTLRGLAAEARVSASYISRILSGERSPSWKVTRRMVHACGGDPEAVRPLWDAAHGRRPARAGSLHAALRGLYLSAACPAPEQICRSSGHALTEREFTGLLHGSLVPDWETVGAVVGVLHGRPDDIRPLWDHARLTQLARATCGLVPERRTPRAEAFG
ncbi:helix-turn-helix domain-containing protein [Streptomyces sp. RS10V-4]|uniref:helix-turn-helix domain-containing protein n=1 Tax=Streptomyces rhizoryzae TaxID=2932493 RepID=UPI002004B0F5|nr:helix-turn-helix transcriptional regulator [Streptomyces rhizoryzae]MCK7625239.1 helix-turn-helix domain-containing protein [Streptomyces rhizoryzae]